MERKCGGILRVVLSLDVFVKIVIFYIGQRDRLRMKIYSCHFFNAKQAAKILTCTVKDLNN